MMRIAVLASGGGSNLQALIDHFAASEARDVGEIVLVASNRSEAGALARARGANIATHFIADPSDGTELLARLYSEDAELLVLAGYLKLVPPEVVRAFRGRMINVHPALLPAYGGPGMYGKRVHEAVIADGTLITGVTVQFVDEHYDHGPIIAQWPIAVMPDDNAKTLAERVLEVEHQLLPAVVNAIASRIISLGPDGRVHKINEGKSPKISLKLHAGIDHETLFHPSHAAVQGLTDSITVTFAQLFGRLL